MSHYLSNNSSTYTIGSETTYLDEVRLHPENASMTTYTYEPLKGVSSITDANGRTVYYEYDELGRLKAVKDHQGNIVSAYDYNYRVY